MKDTFVSKDTAMPRALLSHQPQNFYNTGVNARPDYQGRYLVWDGKKYVAVASHRRSRTVACVPRKRFLASAFSRSLESECARPSIGTIKLMVHVCLVSRQ